MILITGGAYQGKTDYACEKFGIPRKEIYSCTRDKVEVDFDKSIINNIEELVYACVANGRDPMKYLAARKSRWAKSVMIINDISCGLVPMDPTERAAREAVGRTAMYLAQEAITVTRVFAGIPMRLK